MELLQSFPLGQITEPLFAEGLQSLASGGHALVQAAAEEAADQATGGEVDSSGAGSDTQGNDSSDSGVDSTAQPVEEEDSPSPPAGDDQASDDTSSEDTSREDIYKKHNFRDPFSEDSETYFKYQIAWWAVVWILRLAAPELVKKLESDDGEINFVELFQWILENDWINYLNENTQMMMGTVVTYCVEGKFDQAEKAFEDWKDDRVSYFFQNLKIVEWTIYLVEAFSYYILMGQGKVSFMNVYFTALPWTIIGIAAILAQIIFLLFWNDMYAHGNWLLIGMESYTIIQFISSLFLLWNSETYDYDRYFRIWRYVSFGLSLGFAFLYIIALFTFYGYVNFEGVIDYDEAVSKVIVVSQNLFPPDSTYPMLDVLAAIILGYASITLAPTMMVSLVIIAKEMTLKQTAWSRSEDYQEGMFLDWVDMDFLLMFGISEDPKDYENYAKKFIKEYL